MVASRARDGAWKTENRYGETEQLRESPFKQAESALHGLREKLPASLALDLVVGYGVVMPDVEGLPDSAEWDRAVLADGRDFKQFEKWLKRFTRYWHARAARKAVASPVQLQQLQQHLRPRFRGCRTLARFCP